MVSNSANINKTTNNNFKPLNTKTTPPISTKQPTTNAKHGISPCQKFDPVTLTYDLENQ
jgi:hypothetical protein